ncbi:unnamed protein product, partial [Laminaria digitata]
LQREVREDIDRPLRPECSLRSECCHDCWLACTERPTWYEYCTHARTADNDIMNRSARQIKIRLVVVFAAAFLLALLIDVARCEVGARSDEETDGGSDGSDGSSSSSSS